MIKNLFKNKLLVNKKGDFCRVVNISDDMISVRYLNKSNFITWLSIDDLYEVDLKEKVIMNLFTNSTNRSLGQTNFLLELLDNDYHKLITLEEKIKNNFLHYCPCDIEEIEKILKLEDKIDDYNFILFRGL